jgi:uncharacterized protein (DUF2236 family)
MTPHAGNNPLIRLLSAPVDRALAALLADARGADFDAPAGEAALVGADSVSWRVFANPVSVYIGGVAAVLLELAEPRVRTGVWEHSSFRTDPAGRLRRTGLAAMVTVYGAKSVAEKMIAGVGRQHAKVRGVTPAGEAYAADDPELLNWVHATAAFGFLEAYGAYVRPLTAAERDRFFAEGAPAARLYGATGAPKSVAEWQSFYMLTRPRFERSDIIFEFLSLMRETALLPGPAALLQPMFLKAAASILPGEAAAAIGLGPRDLLSGTEARLVRLAGAMAERADLPSHPRRRAERRLSARR